MQFTYEGYINLINLLKENQYEFCDYNNYSKREKVVIMRHDVDNSLEKAVELAKLEAEHDIISTYFILLSTDFYNISSKKSLQMIKKIQELGHSVGLHFDEDKYNNCNVSIMDAVKNEARIMEQIIDSPIGVVSMHRPSTKTLESNYEFDNIINSYGKTFFNEFKYISDSRRIWREDVQMIITSGEYNRLHILTHAFWYNQIEEDIKTSVQRFINNGNTCRYLNMKDNITNIDDILK